MKHEIRHDPYLGRLLWLTGGKTDIAATLDVGIRIIHLSVHGMENLFYRQPEDLSDGITDPDGWKLIGGHRFWLSPESAKSYWPDLDPVQYALEDNAVVLTQIPDPRLGLQKSMRLEFLPDGTIAVRQRVVNVAQKVFHGAIWGINTFCGGTGEIEFPNPSDNPDVYSRSISLWSNTNISDPRLRFTSDRVFTHQEPINDRCQLGVYCATGHVRHENLGQTMEIDFPVSPITQCPDGGCNVEIFHHRSFMELEILGPVFALDPNEETHMDEIWRVNKSN